MSFFGGALYSTYGDIARTIFSLSLNNFKKHSEDEINKQQNKRYKPIGRYFQVHTFSWTHFPFTKTRFQFCLSCFVIYDILYIDTCVLLCSCDFWYFLKHKSTEFSNDNDPARRLESRQPLAIGMYCMGYDTC